MGSFIRGLLYEVFYMGPFTYMGSFIRGLLYEVFYMGSFI